MKTHLLVVLLAGGVVGLGTGCGDGSDGGDSVNAACSADHTCGGDIVGTWRIISSCVEVSGTAPMDGCTEPLTVRGDGLQMTGSATFNADLTYSSTATVSGKVVTQIPAVCMTREGVTLTCTQLTQAMAAQGETMTCAAAGGGCACTQTVAEETTTETGTYQTQGSLLTMTQADEVSESDYCVQGTQLNVALRATPSPNGTRSASFIAQRQ